MFAQVANYAMCFTMGVIWIRKVLPVWPLSLYTQSVMKIKLFFRSLVIRYITSISGAASKDKQRTITQENECE